MIRLASGGLVEAEVAQAQFPLQAELRHEEEASEKKKIKKGPLGVWMGKSGAIDRRRQPSRRQFLSVEGRNGQQSAERARAYKVCIAGDLKHDVVLSFCHHHVFWLGFHCISPLPCYCNSEGCKQVLTVLYCKAHVHMR